MLASLATIAIVLAVLAILLMNGGCTGLFLNNPPRGPDAMGLIVPIVGLGAGVILLTLGALLAAFRAGSSAIGLLHTEPGVAGLLTVVGVFGAGLAAGMAFILWCDGGAVGPGLKSVQALIEFVAGLLGPLAVGGSLLLGVWMTKEAGAAHLAANDGTGILLRVIPWMVGVLAIAGYGLGGSMLYRDFAQKAASRAAQLEIDLATQAERREFMSKPIEERVQLELGEFGASAPLWSLAVYLPDKKGEEPLNDAARLLVIDRILQITDLDEQVRSIMECNYYLYRQGILELIIHAPEAVFATKSAFWAEMLRREIRTTADAVSCRPAWLHETFDLKPDPMAHITALIRATRRFEKSEHHAALQNAMNALSASAHDLKEDGAKGELIELLSKAGYRAPEPSGSR